MPCTAVTHQCEHREREPNPFTTKHLPRALVAAADSDADSERDEMVPESVARRLKREAATLEHQALHSKKNNQCEHCLRGSMLGKYKHSKRPVDPDEPVEYTQPDAFGKLIEGDNVIVAAEHAGMDGEQTALLLRDHFSGLSIAYPQTDKSEETNYLSMRHFAGAALNGRTDTIFKSDTAGELTADVLER